MTFLMLTIPHAISEIQIEYFNQKLKWLHMARISLKTIVPIMELVTK